MGFFALVVVAVLGVILCAIFTGGHGPAPAFARSANVAGPAMAPAAQINPESSPETLESWDSVQHLNLVLGLEQEFNVQFEPEEMDRMKTIGAISDLVESKLKT